MGKELKITTKNDKMDYIIGEWFAYLDSSENVINILNKLTKDIQKTKNNINNKMGQELILYKDMPFYKNNSKKTICRLILLLMKKNNIKVEDLTKTIENSTKEYNKTKEFILMGVNLGHLK